MEKTFEVEVYLTFNDYWRATLGYMLQNWRLKLVLGVAALSTLAFLGISLRFRYGTPPYQLLIPAGAVTLAAIIIYLNAKSVFAAKTFLQGKVRYLLSADGINAVATGSPGITAWKDVPKAFELKNDFLVFYTHERMHVLPKNCFKGPGQLEEFKLLLLRCLGNKVRLK